MAIITEDGTGLSNADSYCSVAYADAYHTKRNNSVWTSTNTTNKELALVKATDYMLQTYRSRWAGTRVKTTQALDWPRYDVPMNDVAGGYGGSQPVWDYKVVPDQVQRACAELALRALTLGDLAPDVDRLTKREKLDVLEVEYVDGASPLTKFVAVDRLLQPYFIGSSGSFAVVRA